MRLGVRSISAGVRGVRAHPKSSIFLNFGVELVAAMLSIVVASVLEVVVLALVLELVLASVLVLALVLALVLGLGLELVFSGFDSPILRDTGVSAPSMRARCLKGVARLFMKRRNTLGVGATVVSIPNTVPLAFFAVTGVEGSPSVCECNRFPLRAAGVVGLGAVDRVFVDVDVEDEVDGPRLGAVTMFRRCCACWIRASRWAGLIFQIAFGKAGRRVFEAGMCCKYGRRVPRESHAMSSVLLTVITASAVRVKVTVPLNNIMSQMDNTVSHMGRAVKAHISHGVTYMSG